MENFRKIVESMIGKLELNKNFDLLLEVNNKSTNYGKDLIGLDISAPYYVTFNREIARTFYQNAIKILVKDEFSPEKVSVVNHELIHATYGVGFGYYPKFIIAHDLLVELGFNPTYEVLCEIDQKPFGITNLRTSNENTERGVTFFDERTRDALTQEQLSWILMSAPIMDALIKETVKKRRDDCVRQVWKKQVRKNKHRGLSLRRHSDLNQARKLVKENKKNQVIDEMNVKFQKTLEKIKS